MTKRKKEFIDSLWMNTDFGQWVIFSSKGEIDSANELLVKIQSSFPWSADTVEKELSSKIAEEFDSVAEYEEYLKVLDEDNGELVEFMISKDVFGEVYHLLYNKK